MSHDTTALREVFLDALGEPIDSREIHASAVYAGGTDPVGYTLCLPGAMRGVLMVWLYCGGGVASVIALPRSRRGRRLTSPEHRGVDALYLRDVVTRYLAGLPGVPESKARAQ